MYHPTYFFTIMKCTRDIIRHVVESKNNFNEGKEEAIKNIFKDFQLNKLK